MRLELAIAESFISIMELIADLLFFSKTTIRLARLVDLVMILQHVGGIW